VSIFDDAKVIILLADHIGIDGGGKANVLGAGFNLTTVGPQGTVAFQHLLVLVDLPLKHAGADFALSLELRDESTGSPFKIVGQPSGTPEPLRIQQIVRAERITIPNVYLPSTFPVRVQLNLALPPGLPLQPGHDYAWHVEVDGQHRKNWQAGFHVLGPPPQPVVGGISRPTDIPPLSSPSD